MTSEDEISVESQLSHNGQEDEEQSTTATVTQTDTHSTSDEFRFPIVGIGASAGGLHAFTTFFKNLPDKPDMAFVLVQHLDPDHESELAEILQTHTKMDVAQVEDREKIRVNCVYVIPPGQSLSINDGTLHLSEPEAPRGQRAPIDLFFRSLADDQGERAVCIILSGTGSDGAVGLKRVKEQGGVVLVQSPEDADYPGMPQSALDTGLVDLAAPVAELAHKLVAYRQSVDQIQFPPGDEGLPAEDEDLLQHIFVELQSITGVDFSYYRRSTIGRRLQRRMQVNQTPDLASYLKWLSGNRQEAHALFKEFLISVTNFFRDEEAWHALAQSVLPALFADRVAQQKIRVWVPGCATGEEAYTMAMLLLEEAARHDGAATIQIFATDLDEDALAYARRGRYPAAIAADVSPERLRRFFEHRGRSYQVRPEVQEIVLFAPHNLVKDAPFARLDLVSCRNLLIYLEHDLQERVFQVFRYALGESGFLFLGSSESAEQASQLFRPLDKRQRIYRTRPGKVSMPLLPNVGIPSQITRPMLGPQQKEPSAAASTERSSLGDLHRRLMLHRYAPPSVLVDDEYQIRYKFGDVGRYLRHREGEPSLNLLDNISSQIRVEVQTGLYSVFRRQEPVTPRRVHLEIDDSIERLLLHIEPVSPTEGMDEGLALVIFEPLPPPEIAEQTEAATADMNSTLVQQLQEELNETRHRLGTTVEEYETSNEELRSSNEELQSMNEEMRSTTEELETNREELRSTNEELTSLNEELKSKVDELNRTNSDLENLMDAANIAILFLDRGLCLQRYTPEATDLFNIIPSDIGRPFTHISHKIDHGTLPELAREVITSLQTVTEEVPTTDGRWFLLKMRPYRTVEDKIEGVVITLVEITAQVEAKRQQRLNAEKHRVAAELGQQGLQGAPLSHLMDLAVQQVADTLDVSVCHILAKQEEGEDLLLIAATGWDRDAIGRVMLPGSIESQSGYALEVGEAIAVVDYAAEQRFLLPDAVQVLGVQSGLSAVILGEGKRYGVLSAYSRQQRDFGEHELDFLRTVAHTIGAAMRQEEAKAVRNQLVEELRALTETLEERVEQRTQQLQKRRAQLSAVASALTVAEQRERERIAQILHDDLQQLLHAVQMRVIMVEEELGDSVDEELRDSLAELESLNEQALNVARSLTVELSPPVLEGGGLTEAFEWLALHMETVYGLHVEVDAGENVEPVNADLRELAFQMVRELLFNVVKHAEVDEAWLTLERHEGQCRLTVADEGCGFDPVVLDATDPDAVGYGLTSIRERLGLFDGTLSVNTTRGAGTRVTLSMPCRQTKGHESHTDGAGSS